MSTDYRKMDQQCNMVDGITDVKDLGAAGFGNAAIDGGASLLYASPTFPSAHIEILKTMAPSLEACRAYRVTVRTFVHAYQTVRTYVE